MSMDILLEAWVSGLIEVARAKWMLGMGRRWQPGEKLKLLFTGYNGTRNTGADVRVEEMLRQIRHILGPEQCQLSVLSQNFEMTTGYFEGIKQVHLPDIFPPMLAREIPQVDGVVACEGSMFKSKFANALTTMMVGALGIASAQNKLSVGYGAEAGEMDPLLAGMVGLRGGGPAQSGLGRKGSGAGDLPDQPLLVASQGIGQPIGGDAALRRLPGEPLPVGLFSSVRAGGRPCLPILS
jgi:hypothetical protein